MKKLVNLLIALSIFLSSCAGRMANPIPAYLPGDENRSCQALQAEMAQLQSDMQRILPETNKFAYNTVCVAGGIFLIFPFFFMDLKDAEKIEWEAMRIRYNRLLIYAAEKECDFGGKGIPDRILSPEEAMNLAKEKAQEQKQQEEVKK
jgi:hypothetical protein